jgi:hypothetical protein
LALLLPLAALVTAAGSVLGQYLVGNHPLLGVDDANITMAYARNIAAGNGFVYQAGSTPVEGATSLLWTLAVALCYRISEAPEKLVLALNYLTTVFSVYFVLDLGRLISRHIRPKSEGAAVLIASALLLAVPPFFVWNVVSLMDVGPWVTFFLWMFWLLAGRLCSEPPVPLARTQLVAAAIVMVLVRPEGIAFALGMLTVSALIAWRSGTPGRTILGSHLPAAIAACVAVAGVEIFRMKTFGYPLPNTFYAKVSSNLSDNLKSGVHYILDLVANYPLALAGLIGWLLLAGPIAGKVLDRKSALSSAERGGAFAVTVIAMMVATYTILGGDHFAFFRFLQPILPILQLSVLVLILMFWPRRRTVGATTTAGLAIMVSLAAGWVYTFEQAPKIAVEFDIGTDGRVIGDRLNSLAARSKPLTVGVTAAGGIALTFHDKIYDLLGLNWAEMAHADPIKSGPRDHAGFNKPLFWKTLPDFVFPALVTHQDDPYLEITPFNEGILKGLPFDQDFQARYSVALYEIDGALIRAYVLNDWIAASGQTPTTIIPWSRVYRRPA